MAEARVTTAVMEGEAEAERTDPALALWWSVRKTVPAALVLAAKGRHGTSHDP